MAPGLLTTFTRSGGFTLPGLSCPMPSATVAMAMAPLKVCAAAEDNTPNCNQPWTGTDGLSMMQARPVNSRRWIAPGSQVGVDGLTFRAPKVVEKVAHIETVDFTVVDLSKVRHNSRKWSVLRAEAGRSSGSGSRSSGWSAPKVDVPGGGEGLNCSQHPSAPLPPDDANAALLKGIAAMKPGMGSFGGLYPSGDSYLVGCTDGVGMKLKLALETSIHETIGIDLVAMTVNDIVTSGAEPLFFLDYFATGELDVGVAEKVIHGIAEGCRMSNCLLLGGETAEMPGHYAKGVYDLSGFGVGVVKKDKLVDGTKMEEGDVIIGLPSSGVHTDGYASIQRAISRSGASFNDKLPRCPLGLTIGEALMTPTAIYVREVVKMSKSGGVKAIAHVAGCDLMESITRIFPRGLTASVNIDKWEVPLIFQWISQAGGFSQSHMFNTFNMGIGMLVILDPHAAHRVLSGDAGIGMPAYRLGTVYEGKTDIRWHHEIWSMG